jgi:hypothetical protein
VKCQVFLVGEGPDDIGDLALQTSYRTGREGFLQPLLRTMVDGRVELEFEGRKLLRLPKEPLGKRSAGELQAKKASDALALAAAQGMNALVLAFDVDKEPGDRATRVERRKRLRDLRESAERGFSHVGGRDPIAAAIPTVIAAPCRMVEAWALADREALAALLGLPASRLDYDDPEELWGDEKNPGSDHPKRVWRRYVQNHVGFAEIGAVADPEVLAEECPDSFPPFAGDVEGALSQCLGEERWPPKKGRGTSAGELRPAEKAKRARPGRARGRRSPPSRWPPAPRARRR